MSDEPQPIDVVVEANLDKVPWPIYREFCHAARALKLAESAFKAAQLAYAEAVKRLSEEAVK